VLTRLTGSALRRLAREAATLLDLGGAAAPGLRGEPAAGTTLIDGVTM
jgi:hypothetical protein